jgi:hypothetical protein
VQVNPGGPYPVDYGAIIPKKAECQNLLVPVCLSSSHIAYGSIRMEPVFMILGQSAATAAALSIDQEIAVQDLAYDVLQARLLADKQVLVFDGPVGGYTPLDALGGIVIDDTRAALEGPWQKSGVPAGVHQGYLHDADLRDGSCRATFTAALEAGTYEIQIAYPVNANRATNVPVTLTASGKSETFTLNQRQAPNAGPFHRIAERDLAGPVSLALSNEKTDGHVIIDAVRFRKK